MSPRYRFPEPRAFRGPNLYNPYAGVPPHWLKANLHAHSRAWGGVTNGHSSAREMIARYHALGFDLAALSNYQSVAPQDQPLRVYEQGYNLHKTHLLVVGARGVDWWDYPLFEGPDEKQDRIGRLHATGALVVIVHPGLRNGFSLRDLERLTGYDAMEVASHFGDAEPQWDAALTAGRLSWALADDDSHDARDRRQMGRFWSMIAARSATPADVMTAIRAGRTYAVVSAVGGGYTDVTLRSLVTHGDTMSVAVDGSSATIRFIGQHGRTLAVAANQRSTRYVIPRDEPYVRTVIETRYARLILNPVVRTTAGPPAALSARATPSSMALAGVVALIAFAM